MLIHHQFSEVEKKESIVNIIPFHRYYNERYEACKLHSQQHYEIIWALTGGGVHIVNGNTYKIEDKRIYWATPGQHHELCLSRDADGFIIQFRESFLRRYCNEFPASQETGSSSDLFQLQGLAVSPLIADDMQEVVTLLLKEGQARREFYADFLGRYLTIFLLLVQRQITSDHITNDPPFRHAAVEHFLRLVDQKFRDIKVVSEYAKELCITPNHLNRILKEGTGITARQHIQNRVIEEAKRQAARSGTSMKEIAYDLGFADLAHFSKFFKRFCGINFMAFKRRTARTSVDAYFLRKALQMDNYVDIPDR